ncbi:MAG: diguanylate cyclase (GGDEF)-like protein [Paraglaciecola sp.]|jgi:diguanylate cyclase (GGDEF)-like protein
MRTIKKKIVSYLNTGTNIKNSVAINQQIQVTNLFCFIGYALTFLLGCSAMRRSELSYNADFWLALVLWSACILFLSSRLILKHHSNKNSYQFSANLVTFSLMILMLYLVVSGGVSNTGPLWIYIVPPVAFFFGGMRTGLRNLSLFMGMTTVILFYPDNQLLLNRYSDDFKSRLIYSFLTVSLLFYCYEYSRQRSFKILQKLNQRFERQARIDPLSGLQNRRGMLEKLEYEQQRSKRSQKSMTLMMCDIDHFKRINDQRGHETGDLVIKQIAQSFQQSLRAQDTVARWGGEEFLFMLPETDQKQAYILGEKLRNKIASTLFCKPHKELNITVSIGIYQLKVSDTIDQAVGRADENLYRAKDAGRNITAVWD